jgi:hypothetical protein
MKEDSRACAAKNRKMPKLKIGCFFLVKTPKSMKDTSHMNEIINCKSISDFVIG